MMLDSAKKKVDWDSNSFFSLSEKPSFCKRPNKKANWFYRIYGNSSWYDICMTQYDVCMVYEGICMVWYMNSNVIMCDHVSPRGFVVFTYESGLDLRHFFYWRWRPIPFTLRDTTSVQEYWSLKMRKHFLTFMWNELINLPFPKSFQWFLGHVCHAFA